jgi:hypothetical protein
MVFVNDSHEIAVRTEDITTGKVYFHGRPREINIVRFNAGLADGKPVLVPGTFGVEPSGQFYFVQTAFGRTELASVAEPGMTVASSPFVGRWLFLKNQRLYLFGYDPPSELKNEMKNYAHRTIICHVFRRGSSQYQLEEEIRIRRPIQGPSPFNVVDADPWSDKVLLMDVRDYPARSQWLLFDLKTRELAGIGAARDLGFFLQADILKAQTH